MKSSSKWCNYFWGIDTPVNLYYFLQEFSILYTDFQSFDDPKMIKWEVTQRLLDLGLLHLWGFLCVMIKPQVSPGGACAQVTSVLRGPLMAAEAGRPNLRPGKQAASGPFLNLRKRLIHLLPKPSACSRWPVTEHTAVFLLVGRW